MKHILSILLLACISLSSYAQTPYDSFAPETSRPVLELSEIKESKEGSKNTALTDTVVVSVLALWRPQFEGAKAHLLSRWGLDDYFL